MKEMISLGLRHLDGRLLVLDQTLLPHKEIWIDVQSPKEMIELIKRLAVRGAPLIGVAAALALGQFAEQGASRDDLKMAALALREARPTAVNLMHAIDKILEALKDHETFRSQVINRAEMIFAEDVALCEAMAKHGIEFIQDGDQILTHCNTGGLATVGIGTALGVIRMAHESGRKIHVYVDETRPLMQGARLTAWELGKLGIPHTLICDNMAGALMAQGKIDKVFVGADRIAANGDAANKIGTYSAAVLAHYHKVPFYVVAPETTFDPLCASGASIQIEQRDPVEVRSGFSLETTQVWNPAFDVTPRKLITSIISNKGSF